MADKWFSITGALQRNEETGSYRLVFGDTEIFEFSSNGISPTYGTILSGAGPLEINWAALISDTPGVVMQPDDAGKTWLQKHGEFLKGVKPLIMLPAPELAGSVKSFDENWFWDESTKTLILDNQIQDANWSIGNGIGGNSPNGNGNLGPSVFNEIPSGLINGTNTNFNAAFNFIPESVVVIVNGLTMRPVIDFITIGLSQIHLNFSPESGENILINYIKSE